MVQQYKHSMFVLQSSQVGMNDLLSLLKLENDNDNHMSHGYDHRNHLMELNSLQLTHLDIYHKRKIHP